MSDYNVIIAGSGMGGLTAGAFLVKHGYKVLILEQHRIPGGYCSSFRRQGYDFDIGVHYIGGVEGETGYVGQVLRYLELDREITFKELDPDCFDKLIFPDFTFSVPKGLHRYRSRIEAAFPGESDGITQYFRVIDTIAHAVQKHPSTSARSGYGQFAFKHRRAQKWADKPLQELLDECTKDRQLQAVLAGQYMDYGEPPETASILVHTIMLLQYLAGAFYPRGGSQKLPSGLARFIVSHGGEIQYHTPVENILVKSKKAVGIRTRDGKEISADTVISNADTWETFYKLIGEDHFPKKWRDKMKQHSPSTSSFSVYLGLNTDLVEAGIRASNYWLFKNYDFNGTFRKLDDEILHDDFTLFMTSPTVKDDTGELAPAGCHILQLITPVKFRHFEKWKDQTVMHRENDYKEMKQRVADRLINRAEKLIPDLKDHIEVMETATPLTQTSYLRAKAGANYGFRKIPGESGPNALSMKTPIRNLYFTGANTIGHGVANTMLSGLYCANLITADDIVEKVLEK